MMTAEPPNNTRAVLSGLHRWTSASLLKTPSTPILSIARTANRYPVSTALPRLPSVGRRVPPERLQALHHACFASGRQRAAMPVAKRRASKVGKRAGFVAAEREITVEGHVALASVRIREHHPMRRRSFPVQPELVLGYQLMTCRD